MALFIKLLLGGSVVFYALIGVMFMHFTAHRPTTATTCDRIERIDGELYCLARMHHEDDNITIIRGDDNANN